jgi:hypothetical protein
MHCDKNTYLNASITHHVIAKNAQGPLTQGTLGLNCKESWCYGANWRRVRASLADSPEKRWKAFVK